VSIETSFIDNMSTIPNMSVLGILKSLI
jgi:hypothetical protein